MTVASVERENARGKGANWNYWGTGVHEVSIKHVKFEISVRYSSGEVQ